jgi:hypothetical protein
LEIIQIIRISTTFWDQLFAQNILVSLKNERVFIPVVCDIYCSFGSSILVHKRVYIVLTIVLILAILQGLKVLLAVILLLLPVSFFENIKN